MPPAADASAAAVPGGLAWAFTSAEDYDTTGILAGVDLSASLYWWMPDLYTSLPRDAAEPGSLASAPGAAATPLPVAVTADAAERGPRGGQAARRPGSPSTAAA